MDSAETPSANLPLLQSFLVPSYNISMRSCASSVRIGDYTGASEVASSLEIG
jgi:hypothetical protein